MKSFESVAIAGFRDAEGAICTPRSRPPHHVLLGIVFSSEFRLCRVEHSTCKVELVLAVAKNGYMSRSKLVAVTLVVFGISAAHAAPPQDELDKFLHQKGLISRLGDSIHSATDRTADLVLHAMGSLGVPYRLGGTSAETGFDCSGFVRSVYQQTVGTLLPRRAEEQAAATQKINKSDLQPGDLVFFNTMRRAYSHVGIYVGDNKFIHAPRTGAHVRVESMGTRYWTKRFNGARRVLADNESSPTGTSRILTRETPAPTTVRLGKKSEPQAANPTQSGASPNWGNPMDAETSNSSAGSYERI